MPQWRSAAYGLTNPPHAFPATYNLHADGAWRDDERDADSDGLSNWLEAARGPSNNDWWKGMWAGKEPAVDPWKDKEYCGYRHGWFDERPFADLNMADPDVDGDTLLDGEDDQDNDDVTNIVELYETSYDLDGNGFVPWLRLGGDRRKTYIPTIDVAGADVPINAFNPCAPEPGLSNLQRLHPAGLSSTLLLRPGARTLVSRVWALCRCAS